MKSCRILVEVTTLIVPWLNDEKTELQDLAGFIAQELGTETPWHISRYYPSYQMVDHPATPLDTLENARHIGLEEGLRYVYLGNVEGETNTACYQCGRLLIRRQGYWIAENHIRDGRCPYCDTKIAGVWTA